MHRVASPPDRRPFELVFAGVAWETALRRLLPAADGFAVGALRWNTASDVRELLADHLEFVRELPGGLQWPPLADWCVLTVARAPEALDPKALIARLQPRASQVLAVVVLSAADRRLWDGAVFEENRLRPLSVVRIVGPRMLELPRDGLPPVPVDSEGRWSRTAGAVGADVMQKIRRARVSLIGAGRNGSQMAFQLAALGISQLRLIDPDVLGIENLDAMPGLHARDVGSAKVAALVQRLLQFRPDLQVSSLQKSAAEPDAMALLRRRAELIATCVDSDTPRMAASLLARETLTVHLDVGTAVREADENSRQIAGDVRLLLPGQGCVSCVSGLADPEATLYELAAPPGSLRRGLPRAWHEERAGSLVTINAVAVGIAVQLWIDLLAGRLRSSWWHRLRWEAGRGLQSHFGPVGAGDDCRYCRAENP